MTATVRRAATTELSAAEIAAIRALMVVAFGTDEDERFTDDDWAHALGGTHVLLEVDGEIAAHASVVERTLEIGGRAVRTGYVEAVAAAPDRQGQGLGTAVMTEIGEIVRASYELGVLGTGSRHFYERLGWRTWRGPSGFRTADTGRVEWTPDDDGYLMFLPTPRSPVLDPTAPIICEWRAGDVW